jgi:hypothetical protein
MHLDCFEQIKEISDKKCIDVCCPICRNVEIPFVDHLILYTSDFETIMNFNQDHNKFIKFRKELNRIYIVMLITTILIVIIVSSGVLDGIFKN